MGYKTNDWKEKDKLVAEGRKVKGYRTIGHISSLVEEWEFDFEKPEPVTEEKKVEPVAVAPEKKADINWGKLGVKK